MVSTFSLGWNLVGVLGLIISLIANICFLTIEIFPFLLKNGFCNDSHVEFHYYVLTIIAMLITRRKMILVVMMIMSCRQEIDREHLV